MAIISASGRIGIGETLLYEVACIMPRNARFPYRPATVTDGARDGQDQASPAKPRSDHIDCDLHVSSGLALLVIAAGAIMAAVLLE